MALERKIPRKWTSAEDAQLTELYGRFHITDIVKLMQFHRSTIDEHISKLDLRRRLGPPVKMVKVKLAVSTAPKPLPVEGPRWGTYSPTRHTNSTMSGPYRGQELSYRPSKE